MTIKSLLTPERVRCDIEASSKKHVLEILSELLADGTDAITTGEIFDSLCAREKLGSTCLGNCAALPHGRIADLDDSVGAFVTLAEPVDFGDEDGHAVDRVFGIAVAGRKGPEDHLENLAAAAALLSDVAMQARITEATEVETLFRLLVEHSPAIHRQASG